MTSLRDMPMRKKVAWSVAAATLALLALGIGSVLVYENATISRRVLDDLEALADLVGVSVHAAVKLNDDDTVQETLLSLQAHQAIASAEVRTLDGRTVARFARPLPPGERVRLERRLGHKGEAFAVITMTADPTVLEARRMRGILGVLAVTTPALALVAWLFSLALERTVSAPLSRLAATAVRVTKERDYTARSGHSGRDEIGQLAAAFDDMMLAIAEHNAAQQRLIAILDATPDMVGTASPDGLTLYTNRGGRALLGYSPDEDMRSIPIRSYHPEWAWKIVQEQAIPAALAHGVWKGETALVTKDGREIPVSQVIVGHRTATGQPAYLSTICRDLTEIKRADERRASLENQLRQAQKMEAVGQLAGGIAHDFNNILTSIMGFTELSRLGASAHTELADNLDHVLAAAKQAQQLTRQLLAFGRRQTLELQTIDLGAQVDASMNVLRRLLREDIRITLQPHAAPAWVDVDPTQMHQVLMNLCLNAQDAMADGGDLTIEVSSSGEDAISATDEDGAVLPRGRYVILSVTDTGVGMDGATREKVFEPFFTTKAHGKGSGLGLSILHGIVKQHRGAVTVTSQPGRGARFTVYLPASTGSLPVAAASAAPAVSQNEGRAGLTVLVAEDDPSVRRLACRFLREHGYDVIEAPGATAAVGLAERHPRNIHVLLTDVLMPDLDGRRLAARVTALRPGVKVVYMSGYAEGVLTEQGVLPRGVAFLGKPFTMDALLQAVHAAVERHANDEGETT